jgi:hypothetical protein
VLDRTASGEVLLIDHREIEPAAGLQARLIVTAWPKGITPGVAEFTVFGNTDPARR